MPFQPKDTTDASQRGTRQGRAGQGSLFTASTRFRSIRKLSFAGADHHRRRRAPSLLTYILHGFRKLGRADRPALLWRRSIQWHHPHVVCCPSALESEPHLQHSTSWNRQRHADAARGCVSSTGLELELEQAPLFRVTWKYYGAVPS